MKTKVNIHKNKQSAKKTGQTKIKEKQINKKKNKNIKKIIATIICTLIIFFSIFSIVIISNIFKIKKITILNNTKLTSETVIQYSGLNIGDNLFTTSKIKIKKQIKENAYIEDVKITKKINGEVIINIKERVPTYMLQIENNYGYINNQGYVLEISQIPLQLPIIIGYETENISNGIRLNTEDLEKLDDINQIMETAKGNGINDIITSIDIKDKKNYIIEIPSENKTVEFGDNTNINIKILWIIELINKEKGISGSIIVNVPNIKKVYFREKV